MTSSPLENELILLVLAVGVLAVVRFEMRCLTDLAHTPDSELRTFTREGWLVCILFFIPIGGIFYLLNGHDR